MYVCARTYECMHVCVYMNVCMHVRVRIYVPIVCMSESEREIVYLTMHSTHFIYGFMASDIW